MATHEIYVGGPASANFSRAMFPAPTFNAASEAFLRVKPSAHKGPTGYQLGRVIDPANDKALSEFLANTEVAQGDVLGAILVPRNCLFKGMFYHVERAATATDGSAVTCTITPSLRSGGAFPAIAAGTADARGFARVGAAAWEAANGAVAMGGDPSEGSDYWIQTPTVIDLTLTALTAESNLNTLRLTLVPIVEYMATGQY